MENTSELNIDNFSSHLFWDVDRDTLDIHKNLTFILQRTLSYGLLSDWNLLYKSFGLVKITEEAKKIRNLDNKSLHFIAQISGSELKEFKCYTTRQSISKHWNF